MVGEEGAAAVGPRGAVVVGEEGAARAGRYRIAAASRCTRTTTHGARRPASRLAWPGASPSGRCSAKPPAQAAPVVVSETTYYYDNGTFYAKAMHEGQVVYQVVDPPAGAVIPTLPAGCTAVESGGATYSQCGTTHYQRVSSGYQVVVPK